jgi:outer membrane biosynthesis protein TonB
MSNLQAQLNSLTAHYTSQIVDLVQQAIRDAVAGSLAGHAAPAKKAAPAPAKKAAPAPAKKAAPAPAKKAAPAPAKKAAPSPAKKAAPAPAPVAAKKAAPARASRSKGEKRSPELIAKTTDALLAYVKSHAGQRIEQIAQGLKVTTKDLALPAKKLLAERRLKTKGQKRATQYFPALDRGTPGG